MMVEVILMLAQLVHLAGASLSLCKQKEKRNPLLRRQWGTPYIGKRKGVTSGLSTVWLLHQERKQNKSVGIRGWQAVPHS